MAKVEEPQPVHRFPHRCECPIRGVLFNRVLDTGFACIDCKFYICKSICAFIRSLPPSFGYIPILVRVRAIAVGFSGLLVLTFSTCSIASVDSIRPCDLRQDRLSTSSCSLVCSSHLISCKRCIQFVLQCCERF